MTRTRQSTSDRSIAKKRRTTTVPDPVSVAFERASVVAAVTTATCKAVSSLDASIAILEAAQEIQLTDDGKSWLYYVPHWYRRLYEEASSETRCPYDEWFDAVWHLHPPECGTIKLFGKEIRTPRYQQAYGITHHFSGATFPAKPFPDVLQHAVSTMQQMLMDPSQQVTLLDAGLLNWYANGDHYMGPHSDEGVNIRKESPIFSLTLGLAKRRFVFTPRGANEEDTKKTVELHLGDGDLLVMGGTTQQTHKHALPKMKTCQERRVNVTLRYFK